MRKSKNELRQEILSKRRKLTIKQIEQKSEIVIEKAKELILRNEFKIISVYYSTENEVQTKKLIKWLLKIGKRVVIPYMSPSMEMHMKEIHDLDFEHEIFMSTLQPTFDYSCVSAKDIDLTITPCLGFDESMNRLGYGLGSYDKFFKKTKSKRWLLAFDIQKANEIPIEDCDELVDLVITESTL